MREIIPEIEAIVNFYTPESGDEKHEIVLGILHGFDHRRFFTAKTTDSDE